MLQPTQPLTSLQCLSHPVSPDWSPITLPSSSSPEHIQTLKASPRDTPIPSAPPLPPPTPVLQSGGHFQENNFHQQASESRHNLQSIPFTQNPFFTHTSSLCPYQAFNIPGPHLARTPQSHPPEPPAHLSTVAPWSWQAAGHSGCCTSPPQGGSRPPPAEHLQQEKKQ